MITTERAPTTTVTEQDGLTWTTVEPVVEDHLGGFLPEGYTWGGEVYPLDHPLRQALLRATAERAEVVSGPTGSVSDMNTTKTSTTWLARAAAANRPEVLKVLAAHAALDAGTTKCICGKPVHGLCD